MVVLKTKTQFLTENLSYLFNLNIKYPVFKYLNNFKGVKKVQQILFIQNLSKTIFSANRDTCLWTGFQIGFFVGQFAVIMFFQLRNSIVIFNNVSANCTESVCTDTQVICKNTNICKQNLPYENFINRYLSANCTGKSVQIHICQQTLRKF